MVLYYVLYRDGSVLCTVPGWFYIVNCTGMVLYFAMYRDGSVLCTVPGWFCIMYCTGIILYYVLYRDGSILCTVPGWFYIMYCTGMVLPGLARVDLVGLAPALGVVALHTNMFNTFFQIKTS